MKQRKTISLILVVLGLIAIAVGYLVRWKTGSAVSLSAAALGIVGIAISMEYQNKKLKGLLWALRVADILIIIANPLCWIWPAALTLPKVVQIAAIVVNVPLAILGFQRAKPETKEEETPEE
jgi:hypothetical protein